MFSIYNCQSTNLVTDGKWHHLVGVCDEGNGASYLYVDGVLQATAFGMQAGKSVADPGNGDPLADLVNIGARAASSSASTLTDQFVGAIQEVALYNYAMTAAQVANDFAAAGTSQLRLSGPEPQAVLAGGSVPLSVSVTGGTPPLSYQWQQDGTNIPDGTTRVLLLANAGPATAGAYDVIVSDGGIVPAVTSSVVSVTLVPEVTFNTEGLSWSAQGTSYSWLGANNLELTASAGSENNSAFYSSPVYVGAFQASFTYQVVNPSGTLADGATFCLQNDPRGAAALGSGGGDLAYGPATNGITNSVAFEINLYGAATGVGGVGVAFDTNGAIGPNSPTAPLVFTNGDVISNFVTYNGTTLTVTMTDATAGTAFSISTNLNITNALGTNIAYAGFTGADGGDKSTQVISNFTFIPRVGLTIQPSASATVIAWPAGVGGYVLQHSSSLAAPNWADVTNAVHALNEMNQVTAPVSATTEFYRLALPVPTL